MPPPASKRRCHYDRNDPEGGRHGLRYVRNHINDTVRNKFSVQKVTSSHTKGETVILSEQPLDQQALRDAIAATGYTVTAMDAHPYEKKGLFSFHRK